MSTQPMVLTIRGKKLGILIRGVRLAKGKTLEECAQAMGISPAILESYEFGEQSPSLPEIELLAYFMDSPLDYFWGRELNPRGNGGNHKVDPVLLIGLRQRMMGVLIRKARLQAKLSAEVLAERVSIPLAKLEAYELGENPIPLPELEALAGALNVPIRDFQDRASPIGLRFIEQRNMSAFKELSPDLQAFVIKPVNRPYLELALRLSEMSVEKLRTVAEVLLEITL